MFNLLVEITLHILEPLLTENHLISSKVKSLIQIMFLSHQLLLTESIKTVSIMLFLEVNINIVMEMWQIFLQIIITDFLNEKENCSDFCIL